MWKWPPVCSPVLLPSNQPVPFRQIFHNTNRHSYSGKEKKLFLRQIIKLQLHGAAFVMCFSMLKVIIQNWRILKHLHSLGHSAVKIIGETLINLPWNPLKSEQNISTSPEGGEKRTCLGIWMGERKIENRHTGRNDQQAVHLQTPLTYMSGLEAEPQSPPPTICMGINFGNRCFDVNQASLMNLNKLV